MHSPYNQPIYMDRKYQTFFNALEKALNREFQNQQSQFTVTNNYSLKREPILFLEIFLPIGNNTIKLKITFNTSFPKVQPKIVCLDSVISPIIDRNTREVNYNNLYIWSKNCNVKLLLDSLRAYFIQNPPHRLKELKDTQEKFLKIRQSINNLMNLNIVNFERNLSAEERVDLYDENKNYEILGRSNEASEIKKEMKFIMNKMLTLIQGIDEEESTINSYIDLTRKDMEGYEELKERYKNLESSYVMLVDRFKRANILDYLENKKERLANKIEELKERVRESNCRDGKVIRELGKLQSDLVATNNIYNQLGN